jgi:surface antigen
MRRLALILGAFIIASACAQAQPGPGPGPGPYHCGGPGQPPCPPYPPPGGQPVAPPYPRWSPGDRLPPAWRQDQYAVPDWRDRNLPPAPRGYRWYCSAPRNCVLVRTSTGIVVRTGWNDEREDYWRRRYSRRYSYQDDIYYRECRSRPDPAGILLGGLIGGLIGGAADGHDAGAVFAGIIIGGIAGAALSNELDCDDRSYAYRTFYTGLNGWRTDVPYDWRNPGNGHHGQFRVRSYYYDPYGFHCARYRHTVWTARRHQFDGRACRQPDGAWTFIE